MDYDDEDDSEEEEQTGNLSSPNGDEPMVTKKPKLEDKPNSPILPQENTTEDSQT